MKKFSVVLALVLVFTSVFSVCANAAGETMTEKFFSEIEATQAVTYYQPMKNEEMNNFYYEKSSIRIVENENGEKISEVSGAAKLGFMDIKMYATQDGLFIYFPQFKRHMDFSFIYKEKSEEILADFLNYEEDDLLPSLSYPEHMILKSVEESEIAGYGKVVTEKFTFDLEPIVEDLVDKDIIPDPTLYGISLDDNKELSEFYWNYADDYSGFAASLFSQNEAIFMYNDKGQLIAADYFTGEGKNIDNVYYELGDIGAISAGADAEDFEMPESSYNLEVFMMFVRLVFSLLVR